MIALSLRAPSKHFFAPALRPIAPERGGSGRPKRSGDRRPPARDEVAVLPRAEEREERVEIHLRGRCTLAILKFWQRYRCQIAKLPNLLNSCKVCRF